MRGARWLLLVAIVAIVAGVGLTYRAQKKVLQEQAPVKPAALPDALNSTAQNWCYNESTSAYTKVEICADDFQESKNSGQVDLKKLVIYLHNRNGKTYDLVKSAAATFFKNDHRMYSEGEVEITLDVPENGKIVRTPVSIKSSGVTFDTGTGRVETERAASFVFQSGAGQATGALYDSTTRQLLMKSDVTLDWKAAGRRSKPMRIEAGSLDYKEAASEIWLVPWGKLTRGSTVVEGQNATIRLEDGKKGNKLMRKIDATKARGSDSYPHRKLEYAADELWVELNDEGEVQKITGQTNARLQATSDASETTVTAHHVEMNFEMKDGESALSTVNGSGDAVVTSKPLPAPNRQPVETHILRSNTLELKMRPGGREIENVVTHTPGVLEFLPNLPAQHHRILNGNDMFIAYGPQNRVDSFRALEVRTQTDPTAEERKRNRAASITTSRAMSAQFDPKTSRLASMEQSGDFTYQEGERRARAGKATLDAQDVMLLETAASISDSTGATSADRIRIDQRTDNFTAEGSVRSSRLPEKGQKKSGSAMLAGDEALLAQARKMVSTNRNRTIRYEGDAVLWQGANRIQAESIDLDREKRTLVADGKVVTNLWEGHKDEPKKKAAAPVLTQVRAGHLVYTEQDRLAVYTGGIALDRTGLAVTGRELRAWLADSGGDSRLVKAFADGAVQILQKTPQHTRTGSAGHGEYYTEDQKIVLREDRPKLVDADGNVTVGDELIYYANDARLLVNGSNARPATSRIKTKKSQK